MMTGVVGAWIATLVVALSAGAAAGPAPPSLVGLWELSRWDNVPQPEAPPWGAVNFQVALSADGRLHLLTPASADADESSYTYADGKFLGRLGLTNDPSGLASLSWATADRVELTYPDGSVASLRRLSPEPTLPPKPAFRCVPVTIRGMDCDAVRVARAKVLLDRPMAVEPSVSLLGTWSMTHEEAGTRLRARLDFGEDGVVSRCTVMEGDYVPASVRASTASYSVFPGSLVSQLFECGDPMPFDIEDDVLTLHAGVDLVFHRDRAWTGECK